MAKKHYKREMRYVSVLTVHVPSFDALLDMLRYDRCCPATEVESSRIERLIGNSSDPGDHIVRLVRFSPGDARASERWRSFGCRVLDERSPKDAPLSDEEALRLARTST